MTTRFPRAKYADADGVSIAYEVRGDGPIDLVRLGGISGGLVAGYMLPGVGEFLDRLAGFSRVINFDRRGQGLSDPLQAGDTPPLEQQVADVVAVMDAVGSRRAGLYAVADGGWVASVLFAAMHPDLVSGLIISQSGARPYRAPDFPIGPDWADRDRLLRRVKDRWGDLERPWGIESLAPSRMDEPGFRELYGQLQQMSASPAVAAAAIYGEDFDVRDVLPLVQAPTLVVYPVGATRREVRLQSEYLAEHLPNARLAPLPGVDNFPGHPGTPPPELAAQIEEFLTGTRPAPISDRILATVLFSDIVVSTEHATRLGDREWSHQLDRHDAMVRDRLQAFHGREVSTAGDSFFATFDGPARAIGCAHAIIEGASELGIDLRVGVHTGECEVRGDDLAGIAVHVGARVAALAGPGEIFTTSTVKTSWPDQVLVSSIEASTNSKGSPNHGISIERTPQPGRARRLDVSRNETGRLAVSGGDARDRIASQPTLAAHRGLSIVNDIAYACAGESQIAYRVMGEPGRVDVIMVAGALFPFELLAEDRVTSRFAAGLAALGRLVMFDKRGVGLSDPMTDWSRSAQEQWAEDLLTVIEAADLRDPVVVSWDPFGAARLAASQRSDLVGSLVLINPAESTREFRDLVTVPDTPLVPTRSLEELAFPSRIKDDEFVTWLLRSGRVGASPTTASRIWEHLLAPEGSLTPPGITTPTLVLHKRDSIQSETGSRAVTEEIEGAVFVQVAGADHFPISGDVDELITEIAEWVTGAPSGLTPLRQVAAVLFTDLVDSTRRAVTEGDAHWRNLLDVHDRTVQECVRRYGGRVVKYTGDGVLALMTSGTSALDAARLIRDRLMERGLHIRVGVHVGDVDVRGEDVSGISVNIAARIMGLAGADEILVSEATRQVTLGSHHRFEELHTTELKGIPDRWLLHRAIP